MDIRQPIGALSRLTDGQQKALTRLGIRTVRDLLFHFPFRYDQGGAESAIGGLQPGMDVSLIGVIEKLETRKSWKRRVPVGEGRLRDSSGTIKVMWFHQPYLAKKVAEGTIVKLTGKIGGTPGKLYLANPAIERADSLPEGDLFVEHPKEQAETSEEPKLYAVYPETRGITSLWFRHAIEKLFKQGVLDQIEDALPQSLLATYHLPTLRTALIYLHTPRTSKDAEVARKRFAFEEVFLIQLSRGIERAKERLERGFSIEATKKDVEDFTQSFPFAPTRGQKDAIGAILSDMQRGYPMSRLLEGDVGSGKTAVAAAASYAAVTSKPAGQKYGTLQVAYMAPTEILAKQHFESFIQYFKDHPVPIALITGSTCLKFPSKIHREGSTTISRTQLLKWVENGEIPIVIGTHSLIEKAVKFKHLALVVIDEQHRFGTNQRRKLARKDIALPHLLSMTATPIPRTLALTIYGDLDLTLLTEMPPGRKPIITDILGNESRTKAYERMKAEMKEGRQAYVICPRIDEPDPEKQMALLAKSVKEEAKRLKKEVFKDKNIDILHSKMKPAEKDEAMRKFAAHDIDILVATSVVEVGVNVPNATVMLIEGAERFGLSQLHQLRGRIVRSTHQAYCFALTETKGQKTLDRLKALKTAKNGFELAELDLMQRGPGELSGRKQWGISDIGMEALKNLKLVEAARDEAQKLIAEDTTLKKYPALLSEVAKRAEPIHME